MESIEEHPTQINIVNATLSLHEGSLGCAPAMLVVALDLHYSLRGMSMRTQVVEYKNAVGKVR